MRFALATVPAKATVHEKEGTGTMGVRRFEPRENESPESGQYIKVPTWLVVLLVSVLGGLFANFGASVWFAASMRSEMNALQVAVSGQNTTSLQSQIDSLRHDLKADNDSLKDDVKANEVRIENLRIKLAEHGYVVPVK